MKIKLILTSFCLLALVFIARSQGFIYDQQSADESRSGEGPYGITNFMMGQSFKPTLNSINFVALQLVDGDVTVGSGATVYINLWSGSISNGIPLASTTPVFMPDGFGQGVINNRGYTNFFFGSSITLTSEATYFLQPVLLSGDTSWVALGNTFNYSRGILVYNGTSSQPLIDLWFREGVIAVPEPSAICLALLGSGVWLFAKRRRGSA